MLVIQPHVQLEILFIKGLVAAEILALTILLKVYQVSLKMMKIKLRLWCVLKFYFL